MAKGERKKNATNMNIIDTADLTQSKRIQNYQLELPVMKNYTINLTLNFNKI